MIRRWTAASLAKGFTLEDLRAFLSKSGFSAEEIEKELALAAPFVSVAHTLKKEADLLGRNLKKREALMKTLDHQMRALPHYLKPEKVPLPPFKQFLETYYYPNRLGLFSNVLNNCEAQHWTPHSLIEKVGADTLVEMQSDYGTDIRHANDAKYRKKLKFAEFISLLENPRAGNNYYMTINNYLANDKVLKVLREDVHPLGNGYLKQNSGYMHFFIGPEGTVTWVHHDLSNNLFVQVYGKKLVRLVPALQASYMHNDVSSGSDIDMLHPDLARYPEFSRATVLEIEVGPGDGLFIPIGWWHHMTSLSISISVACININTPKNQENIFEDCTEAFGKSTLLY
jgi:hypothetical protein